MSRDLSNTNRLSATAAVTAAPLTMACWALPDDITSAHIYMRIRNSGNTRIFRVDMRGDVTGDPVRLLVDDGPTLVFADTGNAYSATSWNSLVYREVSTSSRNLVLNGDIASMATEATTITPAGLVTFELGQASNIEGLIARVALWNVALADNDVRMFHAGASPVRIRPDALVGYWEIYGADSPEPDWSGQGNGMTLTNSPAQADHAPVASPFGFDLGWQGAFTAAAKRRRVGYGSGYAIRM